MSDTSLEDRLAIKQLIEDWVLWRDGGDFERMATTWHPDGFIMTTWCEASAEEFMQRSRQAFESGLQVFHTVSASHVEVSGDRAIAETKMQIINRAPLHDVMVDVACKGRFIDAFERCDGRWGLLSRQSLYEGDLIATVEPGAELKLDPALLASFPEGYKNLGYLQSQRGMPVNKNLPGTRGTATTELMARMRQWLGGGERSLIKSAAATT